MRGGGYCLKILVVTDYSAITEVEVFNTHPLHLQPSKTELLYIAAQRTVSIIITIFKDGEIEAERTEVTSLRSHSQSVAEMRLALKSPDSQSVPYPLDPIAFTLFING